jgi:hypothetical protein
MTVPPRWTKTEFHQEGNPENSVYFVAFDGLIAALQIGERVVACGNVETIEVVDEWRPSQACTAFPMSTNEHVRAISILLSVLMGILAVGFYWGAYL